VDGHFREHFTVEIDFGIFELFDKNGIAHLERLKGSVDPDDPEFTKIPSADAAAIVSVLAGVHDGFMGNFVPFVPGHPETFGLGNDFAVVGGSDSAGFNSHS